ncbi:hypothetical protein CapIbe_010400 [Capra ibex]
MQISAPGPAGGAARASRSALEGKCGSCRGLEAEPALVRWCRLGARSWVLAAGGMDPERREEKEAPKPRYIVQLIYQKIGNGIREGNGTPLQYSCLEDPMDGGACHTTPREPVLREPFATFIPFTPSPLGLWRRNMQQYAVGASKFLLLKLLTIVS